jgi:hypothetical protein
MRGLVLVLVLASLSAGCGPVPPDAQVAMCDAAATLTSAESLAQASVTTVERGDAATGVGLARDARDLAEQGHDRLQTITASDVRSGATWQSLLTAYLHVGQAANALLPDYAGGAEMATSELALASDALATAQASLPPACFRASASPGAAGPSGASSG